MRSAAFLENSSKWGRPPPPCERSAPTSSLSESSRAGRSLSAISLVPLAFLERFLKEGIFRFREMYN